MPSDRTVATYHFKQRYKTLIPKREWDDEVLPQLDFYYFFIYTDGSKMNSGSGVEIYFEVFNLKVSQILGEFATEFHTEIAMSIEAKIISITRKLAIKSDSQAAIKRHLANFH